ncbi:M56 family metallopeptidase [Hymenobacter sp. YC55]|uniref:M56 family metallopeptidase n=1 Tax=Hymenobacter sp. YC55 TaxID=3034019 RepID=UPI0023FA1A50|nr:M56 family metallopeptidase [Hymenobacter sp. YC55]MDF7812582.1 M56 family metallopeptidase [Hymenobacter sp. YC55]
MMPDLLVYLLKVNGALLLFVAVYYALLRRLTFHTLNRWYLLGAILFSALYPLVDVAALWPRPVDLSSELIVWQSSWQSPAATAANSPDYYSWVLIVYWAGVVALGARLLVQGLSLGRLHRASTPTESLLFRQISEAVTPFSFWRTIYVNPQQHQAAELPAILQHEQVHVQQWHTIDVLLGQVQRVFCWFNPAAWLLLRAVQENLEFIADQAVLRAGQVDSKVYQYSLVRLSTLALGPALVTPFTFHTLKSRIKMMNSQKTSAVHMARYVLVAPLVAALLLGSCSKADQEDAVQPAAKTTQNTMQNALYFIDGEKSTREAMEQLEQDVKAIAAVSVIKDEQALKLFGEAAAAGAIVVTTKANANSPGVKAFNKLFNTSVRMSDHGPESPAEFFENSKKDAGTTMKLSEFLILINGKEATEAEFRQLSGSDVKSMSMMTGSGAIEKQYGIRGRNGVIEITTGAAGTGMLNQLYDHNGVMGITKKGC